MRFDWKLNNFSVLCVLVYIVIWKMLYPIYMPLIFVSGFSIFIFCKKKVLIENKHKRF